jgi:hypothetical protein
MYHLLSTHSRLLALLSLLLTVAVARATPAHAVTMQNCNGATCVNVIATMADGKELDNEVKAADEADEPDADEVVHLVANAFGNLPFNWQLQIVDTNNNVYANCGTAARCEVFVWNDEDGQLFFVPAFVPDHKLSPATPGIVPYGPDRHTVTFAGRILNQFGQLVVQQNLAVVFEEGLDKD